MFPEFLLQCLIIHNIDHLKSTQNRSFFNYDLKQEKNCHVYFITLNVSTGQGTVQRYKSLDVSIS